MKLLKSIILASIVALVFNGCTTVPQSKDVPADISKAQLFQKAQKAFSEMDYQSAEAYIVIGLERFGDDQAYAIELEYNRYLIYARMGQYALAKEKLTQYMDRIRVLEPTIQGPFVELSLRLLEQMEKKMAAPSTGVVPAANSGASSN